VHVCGEPWIRATEALSFRVDTAVVGGLGANDGVVVLLATAMALRIQRDRGDLLVDVAQLGTEDWQPAWLMLHYLERTLSPDAIGRLGELAFRDKFFQLLPRIEALLANSQRLQEFRDFAFNYRPVE
jgi:hypothetical protein